MNLDQVLKARATAENEETPFSQLLYTLGPRFWNQIADARTYQNLRLTSKEVKRSATKPLWLKQQELQHQAENDLWSLMINLKNHVDGTVIMDEIHLSEALLKLKNIIHSFRPYVIRTLKFNLYAIRILNLATNLHIDLGLTTLDLVNALLETSGNLRILREMITIDQLFLLFPNQDLYQILGPERASQVEGYPIRNQDVVEALLDPEMTSIVIRGLMRNRSNHASDLDPVFRQAILDCIPIYYSRQQHQQQGYRVSQQDPHKIVEIVSRFTAEPLLDSKVRDLLMNNGQEDYGNDDFSRQRTDILQFLMQRCIETPEHFRGVMRAENMEAFLLSGYVIPRRWVMDEMTEEIEEAVEKLQILMSNPLWTPEVSKALLIRLVRSGKRGGIAYLLRTRIDDLAMLDTIVEYLSEDYIGVEVWYDIFDILKDPTYVPPFTQPVITAAFEEDPQMAPFTLFLDYGLYKMIGSRDNEIFIKFLDFYISQPDEGTKIVDDDFVGQLLEFKQFKKFEAYLDRFPSVKEVLSNEQISSIPADLRDKYRLGKEEKHVSSILDALGIDLLDSEVEQIEAISKLQQLPLDPLETYKDLFSICVNPDVKISQEMQDQLVKLLNEMDVPEVERSRKRARVDDESGINTNVCLRLQLWGSRNACTAWNGEKSHPLVTYRFGNGNCISLLALYQYLTQGNVRDPFQPKRVMTESEIVDIFKVYYQRLRFFKLLKEAAADSATTTQ